MRNSKSIPAMTYISDSRDEDIKTINLMPVKKVPIATI